MATGATSMNTTTTNDDENNNNNNNDNNNETNSFQMGFCVICMSVWWSSPGIAAAADVHSKFWCVVVFWIDHCFGLYFGILCVCMYLNSSYNKSPWQSKQQNLQRQWSLNTKKNAHKNERVTVIVIWLSSAYSILSVVGARSACCIRYVLFFRSFLVRVGALFVCVCAFCLILIVWHLFFFFLIFFPPPITDKENDGNRCLMLKINSNQAHKKVTHIRKVALAFLSTTPAKQKIKNIKMKHIPKNKCNGRAAIMPFFLFLFQPFTTHIVCAGIVSLLQSFQSI